ncbi:MAG TPA: hypothetical protein VLE22_26360 [Bryobacteraceae bacterium]|nr:hypothetical protein [Bryobacteraceae bacterium]
MKPEDIRKLLGGYATGTLTEEERQALFHAALEDQDLFNALADEHAIKELFDDPATRARLLAGLSERKSAFRRLFDWIARPVPLGIAGTVAVAVLAAVVLIRPAGKPPLQQVAMAPRSEAVAPAGVEGPSPEEPAKQDQRLTKTLAARKDAPATPAAPPARATELKAKRNLEESGELASSMVPKPAELRDEAKAGVVGGVVGGVAGGYATQAPAPAPAAAPATVSSSVGKESRAKAASEVLSVRQEAVEENVRVARSAAETPPIVRYHLLRENIAGPKEMEQDAAFRPEDRVRLAVEPATDGQLSVTLRSPGQPDLVLFDEPVRKGKSYTIPQEAAPPMSAGAGDQKLVLSFLPSLPSRSRSAALTMTRGAATQAPLVIEIPLKVQP